jgi:hypothetical protein
MGHESLKLPFHAESVGRALLGLILLVSGCTGLERRRAVEELSASYALADSLYDARSGAAKLEQALQEYQRVEAAHPGDARALAGIARTCYSWAYAVAPDAQTAATLYEQGRSAGWKCLRAVPAFDAEMSRAGGRIDAAAARKIPVDRSECLIWMDADWLRWLVLRDPAGHAQDLDELALLSERALDIADGRQVGEAQHQQALLLAITPAPYRPDRARAEMLFEEARKALPDDLTIPVDEAELLLPALGKNRRAGELLEDVNGLGRTRDALSLEDVRAVTRARDLLGSEGREER